MGDTTITLPTGTQIEIDGQLCVIESGEIRVREENLYSVGDSPDNPTETVRDISIQVELKTDFEPGGLE